VPSLTSGCEMGGAEVSDCCVCVKASVGVITNPIRRIHSKIALFISYPPESGVTPIFSLFFYFRPFG